MNKEFIPVEELTKKERVKWYDWIMLVFWLLGIILIFWFIGRMEGYF